MKKIILVGAGKGGLIHYNSYKKLGYIENVFVVDNKGKSDYIKDQKIYLNILDVLKENNLSAKDVIVDLVVPKDIFCDIIKEYKKINITNIIVEKPFVICDDVDIKDLKIIMVQNYLYSKIFNYIKNYIEKNGFTINSVYSNFSKNRIANSTKGRGMSNNVVTCYNIEMPHQFYMCQELLGCVPKLLYKQANDMVYEDIVLKNHGSGVLIIDNQGKTSYLYSDLTSGILEKQIIVHTNEGFVIDGKFFTYTADLKVLRKGCVTIYKNGQIIYKETFEEDDMFTYMIKDYIDYFESDKTNDIYYKRIINFSEFYKNNKLF